MCSTQMIDFHSQCWQGAQSQGCNEGGNSCMSNSCMNGPCEFDRIDLLARAAGATG